MGESVYIFHYCHSEDLFVGRQSFPLLEGTVPFVKFSIFFSRCDFAGSPGKIYVDIPLILLGLLVALAMWAFSLWEYQRYQQFSLNLPQRIPGHVKGTRVAW